MSSYFGNVTGTNPATNWVANNCAPVQDGPYFGSTKVYGSTVGVYDSPPPETYHQHHLQVHQEALSFAHHHQHPSPYAPQAAHHHNHHSFVDRYSPYAPVSNGLNCRTPPYETNPVRSGGVVAASSYESFYSSSPNVPAPAVPLATPPNYSTHTAAGRIEASPPRIAAVPTPPPLTEAALETADYPDCKSVAFRPTEVRAPSNLAVAPPATFENSNGANSNNSANSRNSPPAKSPSNVALETQKTHFYPWMKSYTGKLYFTITSFIFAYKCYNNKPI